MEENNVPLSSIDGFPGEYAARLAALWITTASDFAGETQTPGGQQAIAAHLDTSVETVQRLRALVVSTLPAAAPFDEGGPQTRHGLGALDEYRAEDDEDLPSFAPGDLPAAVDFSDRLGPVRDQGQRGTCVAFALVALRETLVGDGAPPLSEQYLYWACKQSDGHPHGYGTWLNIGADVLLDLGVCPARVWPYSPAHIPGNESHTPAPNNAHAEAKPWRVTDANRMSGRLILALKLALAEEQPVACVVTAYSYWQSGTAHHTGKIRQPLPGDTPEGNHAMCLMGYRDDDTVPGGGYFIARNSWGAGWGAANPVRQGYALLSYAYVHRHGVVAYTATAQPPTTTEAARPESAVRPEDQALDAMNAYCDRTDLRTLAFRLGTTLDRLSGDTLPAQAISLIEYAKQNRRFDDLLTHLVALKPFLREEFNR